MNRFLSRVPLLALASSFSLLLLVSCAIGIKKWPEPQLGQDKFIIAKISLIRRGACLEIQTTLEGAVENLDEVDVQLEVVGDGPDQGCADCPFQPRRVVVLRPGDPRLTRTGALVHIQICGLDPESAYRVRLSAANVYNSLNPVQSRLLYALP